MGGLKKLMAMAKPEPAIDFDAISRDRAADERQKLLERNGRGAEENIKTSHTGVLGVDENNLKRKNLLGE